MTHRLALSCLGWCGVVFAVLAPSAIASAQVVVVRVDPAADEVSEALESGLERWGLMPDPGYFSEARRLGLNPTSDGALERLVPPLRTLLAIVPRAGTSESVIVEFRDGGTGASLGDATIPLEDGELGDDGRRALDREVGGRLGAPPMAAGSDMPGDAADDGSGTLASPERSDDEVRPLLRVYGGAGIGTRSFDWPSAGERLAVETGPFAALELGIRFFIGMSDTVALGPAFAYQTSIAHEVEETHIAGQPDTLRIRAHRLDATFAVQVGSRSGFQVTPAIGVAMHSLRPEVHHLLTPNYSLVGPVFRIAFRIPIGPIALRIAPEVQWLVTDDPLEEIGVKGGGPAAGAELALVFPLIRAFALELTARDVRAWLPSREGAKATDTGLFATTRLVWQP
jgi:hypothetical protein